MKMLTAKVKKQKMSVHHARVSYATLAPPLASSLSLEAQIVFQKAQSSQVVEGHLR